MTEPGDHVVLGFSGGPDSVFLLEALCALQEALQISLSCVHVNHGIRAEEAERDQAFCMKFCTEREIPCAVVCVDVPSYAKAHRQSPEEAGRTLRYEALETVAGTLAETGGSRTRIAVAHHADDQAETVLHNLLRGTGLKGLGGMAPCSGALIRPLLCMERSEIMTALEAAHLPYVFDSSNAELLYTRNRIRWDIMPAVRAVNAQALAHINHTAALVREADTLFEEQAFLFAESCVEMQGTAELSLPLQALKEQRPLLRRYIFKELVRRLQLPEKDWGAVHYAYLEALLFKQGGAHLDLPYKLSADKLGKRLVLRVNQEALSMKRRKNKAASAAASEKDKEQTE